jgi:hypothetical protein
VERASDPYDNWRIVPRSDAKPADIEHFRPEQRALVDRWIDRLRHKTAGALRDGWRAHPGYRLVGINQEIPYEVAFLPEQSDVPRTRQGARA